jgi:hypothetical protein
MEGEQNMKCLAIILVLCIPQTGCLAVMAVEAVTDVTIAVVTAPIKVVGGIVDAVTGDDEDGEQED